MTTKKPCPDCAARGKECPKCWSARIHALAQDVFAEPVKTTATVKPTAEIEAKPLFGDDK